MTILIVDDEPFVELLFRQRFRKEVASGAFAFAFAFSGEEALRVLAERGDEIGLVLTDYKMPGMSGFELLTHIKAMPRPLPVALMSAYNDDVLRREADELGADRYFTKPIDFGSVKTYFASRGA